MSHSPRFAHGLGLTASKPDWPPLTASELEMVLGQFPNLGPLNAIEWHSPRPFSAATRVQSGQRRLIVKRQHQSVRPLPWLLEEHRFIAHLDSQGLPVVMPLTDQAGHSAVQLGDWLYEVLPMAPGQDLYRDARSWTPFVSLAHAEAAGRTLAELHLASGSYQQPARAAQLLVANLRLFGQPDPIAAINQAMATDPLLAAALAGRNWADDAKQALLPFNQQLAPRLAEQQPLWTHNDWHASNLMWADDQVAAILDFGLADRTFALFDLATAIERNCVSWLQPQVLADLDSVRALVAGYQHRIALPDAARQTLAALLPLVHADFALSELKYFHGITHSASDSELAYRYLIDHARWFAGAEGRRLLAALIR